MIALSICLLVIVTVCIGLNMVHRNSARKYDAHNKSVSWGDLDEILSSHITLTSDNKFDFVYVGNTLPLGRVSAFLSYFKRDIYDEEPYIYYCKRSSRDNEFRENGCVIARTGVYLTTENSENQKLKDNNRKVLKAKEKQLSFVGLTHAFRLGKCVVTINFKPTAIIDRYGFYVFHDELLSRQVETICKTVIDNEINYSLQKGLIKEYLEIVKNPNNVQPDDFEKINEETTATLPKEKPDHFQATEKKLDAKLTDSGIAAGGIQAIKPKIAAMFGEVKSLMNGSHGHGYAAEYANNTMDRVMGRNVENAAMQLDEHGRQIKHGADRIVNNVEVQTKYYKTEGIDWV